MSSWEPAAKPGASAPPSGPPRERAGCGQSASTEPPGADLHPFDSLVALMQTLRSEDGCAWDRAQSLQTLKSYAVEELYEVLDAIDEGSTAKHREELGDLRCEREGHAGNAGEGRLGRGASGPDPRAIPRGAARAFRANAATHEFGHRSFGGSPSNP